VAVHIQEVTIVPAAVPMAVVPMAVADLMAAPAAVIIAVAAMWKAS